MSTEIYSPGGRHSFVHDLAAVSNVPVAGISARDATARLTAHNEQRAVQLAADHDLARRTLAKMGFELTRRPDAEQRALAATVPGQGMEFSPPAWMVTEFASVARSVSPLLRLVTRLDLPDGTMELKLPRFDATTGVVPEQLENIDLPEGFGETDEVGSRVASIAGGVIVSQAQLDRGPMINDHILAQVFGESYAESLGEQLIDGTGENGELTGLLRVAGASTVTYTASSPTPGGLIEASAKAAAAVSTTRKRPPSALIMRPERYFWITGSQQGETGEPIQRPGTGNIPSEADTGPLGPIAGLPVYPDGTIPTDITAAGRDTTIAVRARDILLLEDPAPRIIVNPQQFGQQLSVEISFLRYVSTITTRYPSAIASVQGSGLAIQAGW